MQARPTSELPSGSEWRYEIKWDGFRALAVKERSQVRLLSRNNKDLTARFPTVIDAVARLHVKTAVLDGELVAFDAGGFPTFQALTNGKSAPVAYFAFDVLQRDGQDLRTLPLENRKRELGKIVSGSSIVAPDELRGTPEAIEREARKLRLEGIVAKRRDSVYVPGDSDAWLKFKLRNTQEFVVGGFVPPMRAILIGCHDGKKLNFVGQVYAGFDRWNRRELVGLLSDCALSPFANLPMPHRVQFDEGIESEDMSAFRWVRPKVVVQIAFQEWTRAGLLRHPRLEGIRTDKRASTIRR